MNTQKPRHIQLIDKLLMAPYPVMDRDGGDPFRSDGHLGDLIGRHAANILNRPEAKIMSLLFIFSAAGALVNGKEISPTDPVRNIIVASVFFAASRRLSHPVYETKEHRENAPHYYLQAEPDNSAAPLTPKIEQDIVLRKSAAVKEFYRAAFMGATMGGIIGAMGGPGWGAGAFISGMMSLSPACYYYRAERVIKGDWKVLEETKPRATSAVKFRLS